MLLELTDHNFQNSIGSGLVMVDFWSPWCKPCIMLNPVVKSLAEHNADITIGKLNTVENGAAASAFGVNAIPTIMFFKDGNLVKKLLGYHTEAQLQKYINELKL